MDSNNNTNTNTIVDKHIYIEEDFPIWLGVLITIVLSILVLYVLNPIYSLKRNNAMPSTSNNNNNNISNDNQFDII